MLIPGQLRFSLYSGAVITEGRCSSIHFFIVVLVLTLSYALCLDRSFLQHGLSTVWVVPWPSIPLYSASWDLFWGLFFRILCGFSGFSAPGVWGFPFYLRCPPLNSGIACLAYLNPGIACLASQSSDWLDALWASLSGVYLSMTLVRLDVIGRGWGGTFNYPASTCWLVNSAALWLICF